MIRLLRFLAYLVVILALIILFLPKTNLYYAAEMLMAKKNIFVSDEEAVDKGYALELKNPKFLYESLSLAEVDSVTLLPWVFFNSLTLSNIHVNEGFADFLPLEIQTIAVKYAIYDPTNITLHASSGEDYMYGNIDLLDRILVIHLRLEAKSEQRYKIMLERLSKEEGGYSYEYKY